MAIIKAIAGKNRGSVKRIVDYVLQEEKIIHNQVTAINCSNDNRCAEEMELTKIAFGKTGGRQYKHYVVSYSPEDFKNNPTAYITSHMITMRLINNEKIKKKLDGYQVLVATHEDKEHLHSHIIINSVNMDTGIKFRQSKEELKIAKEILEELVKEYNLQKAEKNVRTRGIISNDMNEYKALRKDFDSDGELYHSWEMEIYRKINIVRKQYPVSRGDFVEKMKDAGINVKWRDSRNYIVFEELENCRHRIRDKRLSQRLGIRLGKEELSCEFERNRRLLDYSIDRDDAEIGR